MAGLRGLRTYTMKGSLLIGTSLLLLNVCAEAVAQNADYPLQALREGREGTSHFSVTVGTDGRAKDCVITKSSGSADLDAETCRMMAMRGRWSPAINANGAPVESKYSGKRSEEHTSELQSLMRISYAVFCLQKKKTQKLETK